jgi:hypothetical protein
MLNELTDVPAGVIGFEVEGELRPEDYKNTLLPAVERAAKTGEIRIVIVMPKYEGISGGATWQDMKMGIEHWGAWKRIALVTDVEWMSHGVHWFGWMSPGELKHFPLADRDAAMKWAAGS